MRTLPFQTRIIPVVELPDLAAAIPLTDALLAAGVDVIEVTLRTPSARDAMQLILRERPAMQVAAGTVTSVAQLDDLRGLGVKLFFSPGSTSALRQAASRLGPDEVFIPGVATASEVMACLDQGLSVMKLFPADAVGGVKLLKSFAGPLPQARFIPTGGVNERNLHEFAVLSNVLAMGASSVAPRGTIEQAMQDPKLWKIVTEKARQLSDLSRLVS